jgi:F-type H+-transporting ATPase subunit gamma
MSDKLSEVQARLASVQELEAVVGAMRAIAAARSLEARSRIAGIRACADMIGEAIADALSLEDPRVAIDDAFGKAHAGHVLVALCSEQGFVGTFNERVVEAVEFCDLNESTEYFLLGDRGAAVAAERGLAIGWSAPMPAHADEVPVAADRLTGALSQRLEAGGTSVVTLVHAVPATSASTQIVTHTLVPFDFKRFNVAPRLSPPLVTMSPAKLLSKLAQEYVFAQLCEAIMMSFAAENEARMRAMVAARSNVHDTLARLTGEFRTLRQQEITAEIVELSAANAAAITLDRSSEVISRLRA